MAVEALDRSGSTTPASLGEGVVGWLGWIDELLVDCSWLGMVELSDPCEHASIVHGYPQSVQAPGFAEQAARRACLSGKVINVRLQSSTPNKDEQCLLALPLTRASNGLQRALLLRGASQSASQRAATLKLCRWASVWLDRSADPVSLPVAGVSESLSDAVLNAFDKHGSATSIATAIVNSIKRLCGCKRVAIAYTTLARGATGLDLIAMSDQAQIDSKRLLPAQILSAMSECASGSGLYSYPDEQTLDNTSTPLPAHAALYEDQGRCPLMSLTYSESHVPNHLKEVTRQTVTSGLTSIVIVLERPTGQAFTAAQTGAIEHLLAPGLRALCLLLRQEMNLFERLQCYTVKTLKSESYQRLYLRHWIRIGLCAALLATFVVPVSHRISARAAIQAKDLQVLIAPQSGFIATSHIRAGDSVAKHQLLATLDTRELQLAANKWRSETRKNQQAADRALATRDKVKLSGLRADAVGIAAELALIESQVDRTELKAPFDGVVLSGDLSQSLGAAVVQGDTLFTIASSDEYELVLDVEEQDIGLVSEGQSVKVRMAALPNDTWDATVTSVLPVAVSTSEANIFRVAAQLLAPSPRLRVGMEGVAKLHVGQRSIAWVYTRSLREQFQLMLWRLGVIR